MPLKSGKGSKVRSSNIKEMMHKYNRDGCIGSVCNVSTKKAQQIATAIAYDKQKSK